MATKKKSAGKSTKDAIVQPIVKRAKTAGWMAILESVLIGVLGALLVWQ